MALQTEKALHLHFSCSSYWEMWMCAYFTQWHNYEQCKQYSFQLTPSFITMTEAQPYIWIGSYSESKNVYFREFKLTALLLSNYFYNCCSTFNTSLRGRSQRRQTRTLRSAEEPFRNAKLCYQCEAEWGGEIQCAQQPNMIFRRSG